MARAEIYLGVGMFVTEFNAPESGAGTHVEHAAYLGLGLGDGCEAEPVVEGQEEDVVLQICDSLVTHVRSTLRRVSHHDLPSLSASFSSFG